jgi:hypothetical protein
MIQVPRIGNEGENAFDAKGWKGIEGYFVSRVGVFVSIFFGDLAVAQGFSVFDALAFVIFEEGFEGVRVVVFAVVDSFFGAAVGAPEGGW